MSDASHPNLLAPGTVIDDRYEIGSVLGEGGMAVVYEARHVFIERVVALKVLSVEPGRDDGFAERFLDEARLAARIDHPNVATIHDFGFVETLIGRRPYIAMARLHGHDLAVELRAHGALTPPRAFRLVLRALDAIGSAHKLGIVHKDLKPENLFLTRPGTEEEDIQLLDFGIAGLLDSPNRRTNAGFLAGTPNYLPPEYIENSLISPALDVYQMGLILVEMMTGRTVVQGSSPYEILRKHCTGRVEIPPPLREGPLGEFFERALHQDPDARFSNATTMRTALAVHEAVFETLDLGPAVARRGGPRKRVIEGEPKDPFDFVPPPDERPLLDASSSTTIVPGGPAAVVANPPTHTTQTRRRHRRRMVAVFALLFCLGGSLVVMGLMRGTSDASSTQSALYAAETDAPEADTPEPLPVATAAADDGATAASDAPLPVPPEEAAFEVHFESDPPGSRIVQDGQVLGVTPTRLMLDTDATTFVIENDGYEPSEVHVVPQAGLVVSTTLAPLEWAWDEEEAASIGEVGAVTHPAGESAAAREARRKRDRKKEQFVIIP